MHGRGEKLLTTAELVERPQFTLGAAVVHPSTRTVTGPGGSTQVEPRVMQVLVVLADAAGAVVTRDTLLARCWGGVYVGDDSLNRAIAGVRRVASGIAAGSFEIETVPRTGYRLVAHTQGAASEAPEADASSASPSPPGRHFTRRWLIAGGAAAAAGGIAFWTSRPSPEDPAARLIEESGIAMRPGTPAAEREAIALLHRAVATSPNNADAWGQLALTLARVDEHTIEKMISPAAKVEKAARRALQLDQGNADAKAALAMAIPYYGDWLGAERRFDAVLAEHPDHLFTRDSRAFLFGAVGRMREAGRERLAFSDAALFDADLQFRHVYGLWFIDRIAEADRVATRGLEMWPRHGGIWFARLWLLASTGRFDRALAHIDDEAVRPQLPPPMVDTLQAAIGAAKSRRPAEIDAAVERVMGGVARSVTAVVNGMMLLNLMGATDPAFELARAYYLEQGPIIAAMQWRPGQPVVPDQRRRKTNMLFTPTAAAMQRDPRFMPLMEEMGLADYWKRRGIPPDFLSGARA